MLIIVGTTAHSNRLREVITTTLRNRTDVLRDNTNRNDDLLVRLSKKGEAVKKQKS